MDLSTSQTSPGQDVDITIISKPNSYIGLLGVDQNALLRHGNDLEKSQVFNELEEYTKMKSSYRGTYEAEDFQVSSLEFNIFSF